MSLLWLMLSVAMAGNIHVDAGTPVLFKLDGAYVKTEPSTRVVIDDLSSGTYHLEVCNLIGNTMAFADVRVDFDGEVFYKYEDKRLDKVDDTVTEVLGEQDDRPGLTEAGFDALTHKVLKGSLKKKLKQVSARTAGYTIDMRQLDDLLTAFHSRTERLEVLEMVKDQVRDKRNATALDHHFGVKSDRDAMHALFEE